MKRPYRIILALLATLVIAAACGSMAHAACTVSTTGVNFGAYDVFQVTHTDSTGTITVSCNKKRKKRKAKIKILIGPSANSGVFNPRQLRHAITGEVLNYNLFTGPRMRRIWGDGTGGTRTRKKRVRKKKPWVATVYGRLFAGQDVSVGLYTDTLTVTILP
ncbi:MAG: spore coat U domain-containing protein [Thermodesulfobacteriota bacterium]